MTKGIVSVDTMYLTVKYPRRDIFDRWNVYAKGLDSRKLKQGIVVNDFVLRSGGNGYGISLWNHDARAYLTDQTDEIRGEDQGMGIHLQFGPKFLIEHFHEIHPAVAEFIKSIGVLGDWPIQITRLDIAVDLFGVAMFDQVLDDWHNNWVGRSKVSKVHFNSKTGELETINIGSRSSAVYLRIYNKLAQSIKEGDFLYWQDVWKLTGENKQVTRVEWEIKPKKGNFDKDLVDFSLFNGFSVRELANYLLNWGRLAIPGKDTNQTRWPNAPFWDLLVEVVHDWADGVYWPTTRHSKDFQGISEAYIKQLSGTISGGMARLANENPNIMDMLNKMGEYGEDLRTIQNTAKKKADLFNKL